MMKDVKKDIVTRLRMGTQEPLFSLRQEAADEIERLRATLYGRQTGDDKYTEWLEQKGWPQATSRGETIEPNMPGKSQWSRR